MRILRISRRGFLGGVVATAALSRLEGRGAEKGGSSETRFVRFEADGQRPWGTLSPCEPTKILAFAGNYGSHLQGAQPRPEPQIFYKPSSCLLDPEGTIAIPEGTEDVRYEGELVVVVGKAARKVLREEAVSCIFGHACGNEMRHVRARRALDRARDRSWGTPGTTSRMKPGEGG